MTLHASKQSVAGQIEGRPLNMIRNIAATPMKKVAAQLRAYTSILEDKQVRPEVHALAFYVLEHAAGVIRAKYGPHDVLPAGELAILEEYNSQSLAMAARAYYYLLLICWREIRHCYSKSPTYSQAGTASDVSPDKMSDFLSYASDTSNFNSIADNWERDADITVGQLTKAMIFCYRKGKWGSSYGGPKWAMVTECLDSFVWGKTSAAMMLDTVWTLAHNTAPIFNKGMLYNGQDKYDLLEILDVQRAGMIPQYVLTARKRSYRAKEHVSVAFERQVQLMGRTLGGVFADKSEVDWPTVKALGGKGSYSQYAAQLGQQDIIKSLPEAPHSPPSKTAIELATEAAKAYTATKQIVPGVKVTLGREAA